MIFKDLDYREICKGVSNMVKNDIFKHCAFEANWGKFWVFPIPIFVVLINRLKGLYSL